MGAYQHQNWSRAAVAALHRHHQPREKCGRRSARTLLLDHRDVRRAPSRTIQDRGPGTIEVKKVHWGAPFRRLTTPTTNTGRSCTKVSSIDPKRCALSPTRATLLFSLRASQTFQPNTPTPLLGACWCHSNARFGERLARVCAVERRVRASDLPTSRGASGRRTGGRASVRRGTSILGWEPWGSETHAHRDKKHVDTIDDDHAHPMLRRCVFALSRATRADTIRSAVCTGGEILLSVMGS